MTNRIRSTRDELHVLVDELEGVVSRVLDHSEIHQPIRNEPGSGLVFFPTHPYKWLPLAREHQPLIGRARELLVRWSELAGGSIEHSAPTRADAFYKQLEGMRKVVEQTEGSPAPSSTVVGVRNQLAKDLQAQREMLADLPSGQGGGDLLLVPDTNAVLYQPAVETWTPGEEPWTVVMTPQVIRELDQLKVANRQVAQPAESFIRRLKEYGRRGDTFAGVPVRGPNKLREVAIDADMAAAPGWLRAGHGDDELLASLLELRWRDLTARVALITRDRNLQNKARLARVPYLDIEEIASPRQQSA